MKVERTPGKGLERPLCEAAVHLSSVLTLTRRAREREAISRGLPAEQCGKRALWLIDDQPLCHHHAANMVLKYMEGKDV